MEISGIDHIRTPNRVAPKGTVQAAQPVDKVTISSEAQKMRGWVEMLKQMPDIRLERVEAAHANPAQVLSEVAHNIQLLNI